MAKTYLDNLLGESERILLVTRQHWSILLGNITLEILLMALLVAGSATLSVAYPMAVYGFILVLVPLIGMIRDVLVWQNRAYVVTNRRVIQISGVFDKKVVDSSLEKVNDVKMTQTLLGRIFDYGDVEILTASEMAANRFRSIGEPVKFKTSMLNAKEKLGYDETPLQVRPTSDIPTLIAKLDDLRRKGVISEAEFQQKKAELLAKM
jgi:uncharacterized membrane protein YdbT with pleckstrin-like domain